MRPGRGAHRRAARRTALVAALLVVVVAAVGTVQAQAASLPLRFAPFVQHSSTFVRGCAGPVKVAPSGTADANGRYGKVTVTGLSGTCRTGYVGVRTASGTVVADGSGAVTGGGFTLTVAPYTPPTSTDARVIVTADTWPVAATWAPPVNPLGTCVGVDSGTGQQNGVCTVSTINVETMWGDPGSRTINLDVTLTGAFPADWTTQQYEVVLNLAGVVPSDWRWATSSASGSSWTPYPGGRCSALPSLHVYAPAWAYNGQPVFLRLDERGSGSLCS